LPPSKEWPISSLGRPSVLYGIGAMGTKLCSYELEKAPRLITPECILSDPEFITDVTPQERWDCDVLEANGEQRLRALVTHITEACEAPSSLTGFVRGSGESALICKRVVP